MMSTKTLNVADVLVERMIAARVRRIYAVTGVIDFTESNSKYLRELIQPTSGRSHRSRDPSKGFT